MRHRPCQAIGEKDRNFSSSLLAHKLLQFLLLGASNKTMPIPKSFTLNNGISIPSLGLGTWRAEKGVVGNAVQTALQKGYKHLDCAFIYDNEAEIGDALKGIDRDSYFITSKLWNNKHHDVSSAIEKTLKDLKLSYLDLYLVHWPITQDPETKVNRIDMEQIKETWKAMEALVLQGKTKSIGVSNFTADLLKELLKECKIKPAVNQVELHPYLPQNELLQYCKQNDIVLTAYSPLGSRPGQESILDDPVVVGIAQRNGKTSAQGNCHITFSLNPSFPYYSLGKLGNSARHSCDSKVFQPAKNRLECASFRAFTSRF